MGDELDVIRPVPNDTALALCSEWYWPVDSLHVLDNGRQREAH